MSRFIGLLGLSLVVVFGAPAYGQSTKAELNTQITTDFPNQTAGAITPTKLRNVTAGIVNSIMPTAPVVSGNLACFSGTTGLLQDCGLSPSTFPLVVGTTPIAGATNKAILFNNTGILGDIAPGVAGGVLTSNGAAADPTFQVSALATYPTLADAAAATIAADVTFVQTLEREAGKSGGARYHRIGASTAAAWRFQSADGQWWALLDRAVTPEMFGCYTATDCTAAFGQMATWLNNFAPSGITINGQNGADYKIWPGSAAPAALVSLSGVDGFTWNFNGSRLSTDNTAPTMFGQYVLKLTNSSNIIINDFSYIQTNWTTLDPTTHATAIRISDAAAPWSHNIQINNLTVNGAKAALQVGSDRLDAAGNVAGSDTRNISLINAKISNTYYCLNFQAAGDDFFGRNIECTNTGRGYFPWNVSNHDVELTDDGGAQFDSVLLVVYGLPAGTDARNSLSNIKVRYQNNGRINSTPSASLLRFTTTQFVATGLPTVSGAVNNGSGLVRLTVSTTANMATGQKWYVNGVGGITGTTNGGTFPLTVIDGTTVDLQGSNFSGVYTSDGYLSVPVTVKNIDIAMDVTTTSNGQPPAVVTAHGDGAAVTNNPLGVTVDNFKISGTLKGYTTASGIKALDLFAAANGSFASETMRNISVSELVMTDDAVVTLDATGIKNLELKNIVAPLSTWTVTGASADMRVQNVTVASGVTDARTVIPGVAGANNFITGINSSGGLVSAQPSVSNISGFGTGVATALGVNIGTAGAPVVNGGALGTPSSGVATNLTGTAASLTAGTATNAVNSGITNDTVTNAAVFPTWVTANTGNLPLKVTSSKFAMNPALGTFGFGTAPQVGSVMYITNAANSLSSANQQALAFNPICSSSATNSCVGIYVNPATAAASYTTAAMYGMYFATGSKGAGNTITNHTQLFISTPTLGSTNYAIFSQGGTNYFGGEIKLGPAVQLLYSPIAPVATTFCTSPSIPANNGTAAFTINVGTSCSTNVGTITMAAATTGWACDFQDVTNPDSNLVRQTGGTTTTVTVKNYSATTGAATNWTNSEVIRAKCAAY